MALWKSFPPDRLWEGDTRETSPEAWEAQGQGEMAGIEWGGLRSPAAPDRQDKRNRGTCNHCGPANAASEAKFIPEDSSLAASLTKSQK